MLCLLCLAGTFYYVERRATKQGNRNHNQVDTQDTPQSRHNDQETAFIRCDE